MSVRANIEPSSWESEFFRFSCARLMLSDEAPLLQVTELNQYSLVQAKVPAHRVEVIDGLSKLGFTLAEGEIDLLLDVNPEPADMGSGHRVALAQVEDIPALRAVASVVFRLSRFRPPWYRMEDSGRFYALWLEKAVLGTFDHQCLLVVDTTGNPMGFVTLRDLGNAEARIGLLAVWPNAGGKGIGAELMLAAERWCAERKIGSLRIATQAGNIRALKLYLCRGATIVSSAYWLYRGLP